MHTLPTGSCYLGARIGLPGGISARPSGHRCLGRAAPACCPSFSPRASRPGGGNPGNLRDLSPPPCVMRQGGGGLGSLEDTSPYLCG